MGLPSDVYTVQAGGGQHTLSQVEEIAVGSSAVIRHINLSVQFAGSISGRVTGPAGAVTGADVTAFGADGQTFSAATDTAGDYTVTALPGQTYTVTAFAGGLFAATPANIDLAGGQVRTGVNLSLASGGRISGRTLSLADGSIVPAVLVEATGSGNSFSAQSDSNGDFSIDDLPPGNYVVTAFNTTFMTTSVPATVTSGGNQIVEIRIAPLGQVSGTVRAAASGLSLPNLVVSARDAFGAQASDLTDAMGAYVLDGLDAGTYSIVVGNVGSPGAVDSTVTLTPAATTAVADFSVPIVASVSGTVLAPDGVTPVLFATIGLTQGAAPAATATSDEQGKFRFLALVTGNFQLEASATNLVFSPRAISLTNGANLTNQNLTAGTAAIGGTVRDAASGLAIANASIGITQTGPGAWSHFVTDVRSDAAGVFNFPNAVAGTYGLFVRATQHASAQQSIAISASGVTNLVFNLAAESTLQGTIRDATTGQGLQDAIVLLVRNDNELLRDTALSGETGAYAFEGLAAGTYSIVVRADDHQTLVIENLTVGTGVTLRDVALSGPGITVTGSVQNSAGTPGGILVVATNPRGFVVARTNTASDGTYFFGVLPPGTHMLVAHAEGYSASPPANVNVSQGQTLGNVNLILSAAALDRRR